MIGIYGANGFIGRHLIRAYGAHGIPIKAVSRRFDEDFISEFGNMVETVVADLASPIEIAASLQGVSTVVQLVSTSSPGLQNNHSIADIRENVVPQVEFLQNCIRSKVKRYVFISSGGTVYGPGTDLPFSESHPTNPICSHGLTKLIVEKYIHMYGHVDGLEYVILRLSNPFGPGQKFRKGQGLIPAILDRHRRGMPATIFGDGQAKRDYIYIDDVIDAIRAAVDLEGKPRITLNIGSGSPLSIYQVIEAIEEILGCALSKEYVDTRKTDVDVNYLDIALARRILGWHPKVAFHDGIGRTIAKP